MCELGGKNSCQGHIIGLADSCAAFNLADELFDRPEFEQADFFDAFRRQQFAHVIRRVRVEETAMDRRAIWPLWPLTDNVREPWLRCSLQQVFLAQTAQLHS